MTLNVLRAALAAFVVVLASSLPARAALSDMWWNPSESGWGANLVQQADIMFLTLYVYGDDGKARWYTAPEMKLDPTVDTMYVLSGQLYETIGPALGTPYDPSKVVARAVGGVQFTYVPLDVTGTLSFTVDGKSVNKTLRRFGFRNVIPDGTYHGAIYRMPTSTCQGTPLGTTPLSTTFTISTTPPPAPTFTMTIDALAGRLAGAHYIDGSYQVAEGNWLLGSTTYDSLLADLSVDDDGIRGKIVARHRLTGCLIGARFAGVRGP